MTGRFEVFSTVQLSAAMRRNHYCLTVKMIIVGLLIAEEIGGVKQS
jgi:hypothetical protein